MKKSLIALLLIISYASFSQVLEMDKAQDISYSSQFTNTDKFESVKLLDGSLLAIGDTIKVGDSYNGKTNFSYIYFGKVNVAKALLSAPQPMGDAIVGSILVITDIFAKHTKMTKKSSVNCMLYAQDINQSNAMGAANRTIFDLSKAIEIGEVINLKAAMTKEQAIALLKEKKELFDLGLLTEDEFNKVKVELTPIIMGK